MPRTRVAQAVVAVLTALLVPASAGAADARPLVQQHYSDVYDVLLPDPDPDGSFCGGLVDVPLHGEVDGYFSVKDHGDGALSVLRRPVPLHPRVHQPADRSDLHRGAGCGRPRTSASPTTATAP